MSYVQTIIDNFSDNVLDTTEWEVFSGAGGVSETGQALRITTSTSYPAVRSQAAHDISSGILAAKLTRSGTASGEETEFTFGAHDGAGNSVSLFATPYNASISMSKLGAATISGTVISDATVGIGPSWAANTWLGVGNLGDDGIIHIYKSVDAVTWTEIARCSVGGTFGKTTAGFEISSGNWGGTTSFVAAFKDATYWDTSSLGQTVIDNFDDGSIDTLKWDVTATPGSVTETSGKLNLTDDPDFPTVIGLVFKDIRSGILAAKLEETGTPTVDSKFYFGVHNNSGNGVELDATPANASFEFYEASVTITDFTIFDTTVGVGPSWIDNWWLGIGNVETVGSDTVIHFYKSPDGTTWFEIARCIVFGTASFTGGSACFVLGSGTDAVTASSFVSKFDDASYFSASFTPTTKVRMGSAWVDATLKVRVGGAWVSATPKVRSAGSWVTPS